MKTAFVLGVNLVLGVGGLVFALREFGAPAVQLLRQDSSPLPLLGFVVVMAASVGVFTRRWALLLRTLGARIATTRLVRYRLAGQSLSQLVPSGRLGGDPLRAWLLVQDRVGGAPAIASVAVDRTLEWGAGMIFACVFASILLQRGVPRSLLLECVESQLSSAGE